MNIEDFSDEDYDNLPVIDIFDARVSKIVKETKEIEKKDLSELLEKNETEEMEKNSFDNISQKSKSGKRKSDLPLKAEDVIKLSRSAKKRLKILELQVAHDARNFALQNKFVFDKLEEQEAKEKEKKVEELELPNRNMFLKFRYRYEIHRIQVKLREQFQYIFPKVADVTGLKVTGMLLCLDDRNIQLCDTPESLNIKILDVIVCLPFQDKPEKGGYNMMLLKFQSNDFRRRTEFYVHMLEKFSEIKIKYATIRELSIEDITFKFDDEIIDLEDNPLDIEMESGSVIDVTVKMKEKPATSSCDTETSTQEISTPSIPMMTVIDLD